MESGMENYQTQNSKKRKPGKPWFYFLKNCFPAFFGVFFYDCDLLGFPTLTSPIEAATIGQHRLINHKKNKTHPPSTCLSTGHSLLSSSSCRDFQNPPTRASALGAHDPESPWQQPRAAWVPAAGWRSETQCFWTKPRLKQQQTATELTLWLLYHMICVL